MTSDLQIENMEAIAYGLEPPHAEVWVADEYTILWLTVHTDRQRMSALRLARKDRAAAATTHETMGGLDGLLKSGVTRP